MIRVFLVALQFLTLVPVTLSKRPSRMEMANSFFCYPLIGLIIGCCLVIITLLLSSQSSMLVASIALLFWVLITGGLHIDGLADCADAWVGGRGDKNKTLLIMKDSYCGPAGVTSIVLLLLVKYSSLFVLIENQSYVMILIIPILSRSVVPIFFYLTPYIREDGLGKDLELYRSSNSVQSVSVFIASVCLILLIVEMFWLILVLFCNFVVLRRLIIYRIDGITGDVAGAVLEIIELSLLVSMCVFILPV